MCFAASIGTIVDEITEIVHSDPTSGVRIGYKLVKCCADNTTWITPWRGDVIKPGETMNCQWTHGNPLNIVVDDTVNLLIKIGFHMYRDPNYASALTTILNDRSRAGVVACIYHIENIIAANRQVVVVSEYVPFRPVLAFDLDGLNRDATLRALLNIDGLKESACSHLEGNQCAS